MGKALTETLETLEEKIDGEKISFGEIVEALNSKGFGSLLVGLSLILVLPTGAIPGVPAFVGIFIMLVSAQILFGRDYPWVPNKLDNMKFNFSKYKRSVEKAKPYTEWIDGFFKNRLEILTHNGAKKIVAFITCILAATIIVIGFIPFLPMLPGLTILFFGLGLMTHDGLMTALGFVVLTIAAIVLPYMIFQWM